MLRLFALLSGLTGFTVFGVVILTASSERTKLTISEQAASRKWSYLLVAISGPILSSIFAWYLYHSFGPQFGLPFIYYVTVVIAWLCSLPALAIPYHPVKKDLQRLHAGAFLGMSFMIVLATITIAFAHDVNLLTHVAATILAGWYLLILYFCVLFPGQALVRHLKPYFLTFELSSMVSFFAFLMIVAFRG